MRILAAGGGSGGHVTPVAAVLAELKRQQPETEARFWCDQKFGAQATAIMHEFDPSLRVDKIISGKLRRYHSLPLWRQLLRPFSIVLPNIFDSVKVIAGFFQSIGKLCIWRPDVIFLKGGFVCLPIGVAARVLGIPYIIHDSDAHPGLTNRLLAKWATAIATGAPLKYYSYPASITHYTGIPLSGQPQVPSAQEQRQLKHKLGYSPDLPLVVVTGGGLGAQRLNQAVVAARTALQGRAMTVLVSGKANYQPLRQQVGTDDEFFELKGFISGNMLEYLAAADVVIARAGATTMLELASLGRPSILVPSIYLTGGHQIKNATVYEEAGAARIADEQQFNDSAYLSDLVLSLLENPAERAHLSQQIRHFAKPQAAKEVVALILGAVR